MTILELKDRLEDNPKFFKSFPWQAQVVYLDELVESGYDVEQLAYVLRTTPKWVNNCLKVHKAMASHPEWHCKHARSMQDALTTINIKTAHLKRQRMEQIASETTSGPRPVIS